MKIQFISLCALFVLCSSSYAMQVTTMPDETVLKQWLREKNLEHFTEHTHIIDQLAGKKLCSLIVMCEVERATGDYLTYLDKQDALPPFRKKMIQACIPMFCETLLQGNPAAVQELKQMLQKP